MPTNPQAFDTGLGLNLVGVPFDASTVLHAVRASAEGEVAERANAQAQALGAHAKQAGRHLKTIREVLTAEGLSVPESPQDADAYNGFVDTVSTSLYDTLDEAGQRAYLAGWWLGGWTRAANLVAISLYLKDAAPDDAYLTEVVQAYAGQLTEAVQGLAACRDGAPGALDAALAGALATLQAVPAPAGVDALAEAGAFQEALEAMDAHIAAVRGAVG